MPYASSPLLYPLAGRKNQNAKRPQSPWAQRTAEWTNQKLMPFAQNVALQGSDFLQNKAIPWARNFATNSALQALPVGNTVLNQGKNLLQNEVSPRLQNAAIQGSGFIQDEAIPIGKTVLNHWMPPQQEFEPFNPASPRGNAPEPSRAMLPSSPPLMALEQASPSPFIQPPDIALASMEVRPTRHILANEMPPYEELLSLPRQDTSPITNEEGGYQVSPGRSTWTAFKERLEENPESKSKWDAYQARRTGQKDERQAAVTARARQRAGLPSMLDVAIQERIKNNKPLTPAMEAIVEQKRLESMTPEERIAYERNQAAVKMQKDRLTAQSELSLAEIAAANKRTADEIAANKDIETSRVAQADKDRAAASTRHQAETGLKKEELGLEKEKLALQKKQAEEERKRKEQVAQEQKTVSQLQTAIAKATELRQQAQELRVNNLPVPTDLINNLNKAEIEVDELEKKTYSTPSAQQAPAQGVASGQQEPFMPVGMSGGQAPVSEAEPDGPWKKNRTDSLENIGPFIKGSFGGENPTAETVYNKLVNLAKSDYERGYVGTSQMDKETFSQLKDFVDFKDRNDPVWDDELGNITSMIDKIRNAKTPQELGYWLYKEAERASAYADEDEIMRNTAVDIGSHLAPAFVGPFIRGADSLRRKPIRLPYMRQYY